MRDPVCGMAVGPDAAAVEGYPEYGSCSEHCRQAFIADPGRYLEKDTVPDHEENATQKSGLRGRSNH
jgi:YHS domain-containing protein